MDLLDSFEPKVLWSLCRFCFSIATLIAYPNNPHQSHPRIHRDLRIFWPEKNRQIRVWEIFEMLLKRYWLEVLGSLEDILSFVADATALAKRPQIFVALMKY